MRRTRIGKERQGEVPTLAQAMEGQAVCQPSGLVLEEVCRRIEKVFPRTARRGLRALPGGDRIDHFGFAELP